MLQFLSLIITISLLKFTVHLLLSYCQLLLGILAKKKEAAQLAAQKREEAKKRQEEEKKSEERRKSMEYSSVPSTPSSTERPGDRLLGSREGSKTSRVEVSILSGSCIYRGHVFIEVMYL